MIITDSFVWINYPKTASTFVRKVLRDLYPSRRWQRAVSPWLTGGRSFVELELPNTRIGAGPRHLQPTPHGVVSQIPAKYRNRQIVSAIRDPYERAISLYTYGDWRNPEALNTDIDQVRQSFPAYPDLTFADYLEFARRFRGHTIELGNEKVDLGSQSFDFLMFFSRTPIDPNQPPRYESRAALVESLAEVRFLSTENINAELAEFLAAHGFSDAQVSRVRNFQPVNRSSRDDREYFDESLRDQFARNEWLLFELFDVYCRQPAVGQP